MAEATLTRESVRRFVTPEEVADDTLDEMIADVVAVARVAAPCLAGDDLSEDHARAAVAVMRDAVLRWVDSRSGAVTSVAAGPFAQAVDTTVRRSGHLQPSEIARLQEICRQHSTARRRQAFTLARLGDSGPRHTLICSVNFGGECSCGAVLSGGEPLWGDE